MPSTGPSLNVLNRLHKDVIRNNILREFYPHKSTVENMPTGSVSIPFDLIRIDDKSKQVIDKDAFVHTGAVCIAGYVGMALLLSTKETPPDTLTDRELMVKVGEPVRLLTCDNKSLRIGETNKKGIDR